MNWAEADCLDKNRPVRGYLVDRFGHGRDHPSVRDPHRSFLVEEKAKIKDCLDRIYRISLLFAPFDLSAGQDADQHGEERHKANRPAE